MVGTSRSVVHGPQIGAIRTELEQIGPTSLRTSEDDGR
jgi:hypothetical protein